MKRSALRRYKTPAQSQHQKEIAEVMPLLQARSRGWCECGDDDCASFASQVHHVVRKSQGGSNELSNLRYLSFDCHNRVHSNIAWARDMGLLKSKGEP